MNFKSDFLNEIKSRGFIYQASDIEQLDDLLSEYFIDNGVIQSYLMTRAIKL